MLHITWQECLESVDSAVFSISGLNKRKPIMNRIYVLSEPNYFAANKITSKNSATNIKSKTSRATESEL